ncbi:MAG: ribonuclease HII [Alphaproteobacteria bacterium]|nr:ribonuclease HII [Alphaproteobacteria bacterium]
MAPLKRKILKPDFFFEDDCGELCCGIDEVGRGPLAGPVVAAAVIIDRARMPKKILSQINDSKKLTPAKRESLFNILHEYSYISIEQASVAEIDEINILQASLLAMRRACDGLEKQTGKRIHTALIDGNKAPALSCAVKTIVGGDGKSLSIAAASIVAKYFRDRLMKNHADDYPHYGWERNAGYGTAEHLKAIEIHGITPLHRRSFAPVSKQLVKENSIIY